MFFSRMSISRCAFLSAVSKYPMYWRSSVSVCVPEFTLSFNTRYQDIMLVREQELRTSFSVRFGFRITGTLSTCGDECTNAQGKRTYRELCGTSRSDLADWGVPRVGELRTAKLCIARVVGTRQYYWRRLGKTLLSNFSFGLSFYSCSSCEVYVLVK